MEKERTLSPLEMCDPEPIWCGTEEEKYVPLGEEDYYNTSRAMLINNVTGEVQHRKWSIQYTRFFTEHLRWECKYAEYNGLAAAQEAEEEAWRERHKYYNFCLGELGEAKFKEFISKYQTTEFKSGMNPPNAYYVFVIHPTPLGEVVDCEVRIHKGDHYELLEKCEVVNEI